MACIPVAAISSIQVPINDIADGATVWFEDGSALRLLGVVLDDLTVNDVKFVLSK